jgi:hypothetical protein
MGVSRHILVSRYIHISDKFYGTKGLPYMLWMRFMTYNLDAISLNEHGNLIYLFYMLWMISI